MEQDIIEQLVRNLRMPRRRKAAIERELRSHLLDARHDLELAGWPSEQARQEAGRRLGDPSEIAAAFTRSYRPSRSTRLLLAAGLASGMLLGLYGWGGNFASATAAHRAAHPSYHLVTPAKTQSTTRHCDH